MLQLLYELDCRHTSPRSSRITPNQSIDRFERATILFGTKIVPMAIVFVPQPRDRVKLLESTTDQATAITATGILCHNVSFRYLKTCDCFPTSHQSSSISGMMCTQIIW